MSTAREDARVVPLSFAGFEGVNRYWDPQGKVSTAKLLPGEYYITARDETLVTVLGTSIAVCISDVQRGVGGMAHFMVPMTTDVAMSRAATQEAVDYGCFAMELLIGGVVRQGAARSDLQAMIFGAASIWPDLTGIANAGARFVRTFLEGEEVSIVHQDMGHALPRKIYFRPQTAEYFVKLLDVFNDTIRKREEVYLDSLQEGWLQAA